MALRQRHLLYLRRLFSSASSAASVPLLWSPSNEELSGESTIEIFTWGRGSSGQLGGGKEEIRFYPTPVASLRLPPGFRLSPNSGRRDHYDAAAAADGGATVEVGISCGLTHSSVLVDGRFWIWGKGEGGRLGFGHENPVFVPTLNPNLDEVRCIALGGIHSTALTRSGEVFTWGYGGLGALGHSVYHGELLPRLVEGTWMGKISQLATSGAHTAVITDSGELYIWGRDGGGGRLGLGGGGGPGEVGSIATPFRVNALAVPVAAVSCGGFFTMALTTDGQLWSWGDKGVLYMWGNANDCQPGVPRLRDVEPLPVQVKFLTDDERLGSHQVLSVSVGAYHAMCLVLRQSTDDL